MWTPTVIDDNVLTARMIAAIVIAVVLVVTLIVVLNQYHQGCYTLSHDTQG